MKSIFYVGATLMIGASIYGFVDYKKTSQQKEFNRMYEPAGSLESVASKEETIPVVMEEAAEIKKPVARSKKAVVKTEPAEAEPAVMRSNISIDAVEKIETAPAVPESSLKESKSAEKYKKAKKRKLNSRLFSRAPLREEQEELILPKPAKVKASKTKE